MPQPLQAADEIEAWLAGEWCAEALVSCSRPLDSRPAKRLNCTVW